MELLSRLLGAFKSKLGYMVLSYAVSTGLAGLKAGHPDWVLPSPAEVLGVGALAISGHILTDIWAITKGLAAGGNLSQLVSDAVKALLAQPGASEAAAKVLP